MGAIKQYSDEAILKAIEALEIEGKPILVANVRNELGGGGHDRIKKLVNEYKLQKTNETDGSQSDVILPHGIKQALERNTKSMTSKIEQLTCQIFRDVEYTLEEKNKVVIAEYQESISAYEEAEEAVVNALEKSDNEKDELSKIIESLKSENAHLLQLKANLEGQLAHAEKRIVEQNSIVDDYNTLQREFGKLEGTLAALQGTANHTVTSEEI